MRHVFIGVAGAFALAMSSAAAGTVLFVDGSKPPGGTASSWATATNDLGLALAAAAALPFTEIWIAEGTYVPGPVGNRFASFTVQPSVRLVVRGGFAGVETSPDERDIAAHPTILSGDLAGDDGPDFTNMDDNAYHVVVASGTCTLDGLIVEGGCSGDPANVGGGAIRAAGAKLTLVDSIVEHSTAWQGGGIYLENGALVLERTKVRANAASFGAGMHVFDASIVATDCAFEANVSQSGGALVFGRGTGSFARCEFKGNGGNTASGSGGAVSLHGSEASSVGVKAKFDACTFEDNTATFGAAIAINGQYGGGELTIARCRIAHNEAAPKGGALYLEDTGQSFGVYAFVTDSAFVDNAGGQIFFRNEDPNNFMSLDMKRCTLANPAGTSGGLRAYGGFVTVVDSIFWLPNAATITDAGGNPFINVTNSCISGGYPGAGNFATNPQFVAFAPGAAEDLRLVPTSPCVDRGDPAVPTTQQALLQAPRTIDGNADGALVTDLGAYEWSPLTLHFAGVMRSGSTVTLGIAGAGGFSTVLFVGAAPGAIALPGFGGLFIDLAKPWVLVATGLAPSTLQTTLPAGIPPGIELHLQAAGVNGAWRVMTNTVVTKTE